MYAIIENFTPRNPEFRQRVQSGHLFLVNKMTRLSGYVMLDGTYATLREYARLIPDNAYVLQTEGDSGTLKTQIFGDLADLLREVPDDKAWRFFRADRQYDRVYCTDRPHWATDQFLYTGTTGEAICTP